MRISNILLSLALTFKTIYSRAVDNNSNILSDQLKAIEEDSSYELVKSDNFIYKYHCYDEKEYCNKIKNDLDYAFNTISKAFEIYQPIVFEVFVDDLELKYGFGGALAAVTDENYVPLRTSKNESSAPNIYPQALVKQLKLNKQPKYKKNDFIMIINNCNSVPEFKNNEIRSILIHETLHGLGFESLHSISKIDDNDTFNIDDPEDFLLLFNKTENYAVFPYTVPIFSEKLLKITDKEEYINQLFNTEISKFMPFSIFDKNLVSLTSGKKLFENLEFYYKEINEKCLSKQDFPLLMKTATNKYLKDCLEKLSPETQEIVTSVVKDNYFKSHTLGILTKDGDVVPLQTMDGKYLPGSSVSHINNPLLDSLISQISENPDAATEFIDENTGKVKKEAIIKYYDDNYVLYYSDWDDFTVEEMLELLPNNPKHPLIGDGIVKIMKTLGWKEKGEKRSNEMYYLDETINIPEAKSFEYLYMRKYKISDHGASLTNDIEVETDFPTEEEITLPVHEEDITFPTGEEETIMTEDEDIYDEPTLIDEEPTSIDEEPTSIDDDLDEKQSLPVGKEKSSNSKNPIDILFKLVESLLKVIFG